MAADQCGGQRRRKRRLTPQEKYQVWQEVVAGQGSQREIADRWGIDRSTVTQIVKTAKQSALNGLAASRPGRPGKSAAELALEDAQAEIERLKETVTEQAVELHLFRGYAGDRVKQLGAGRAAVGGHDASRPVISRW